MRHYIFMRKRGRNLACLAHVRPWVPLQAPELGHQPLLPTPSQIRKENDIVTLACQQLCALCHRGRLPQTTPSVSFQTVPVHWFLTVALKLGAQELGFQVTIAKGEKVRSPLDVHPVFQPGIQGLQFCSPVPDCFFFLFSK